MTSSNFIRWRQKICAIIAPQFQNIPEETLVTAVSKAQGIKKKKKSRKVSDRKGMPLPCGVITMVYPRGQLVPQMHGKMVHILFLGCY